MSDLVRRLRDHVNDRGGPAKDDAGTYIGTAWPMMLESADEIERLRSQLGKRTEALEAARSEIVVAVSFLGRDLFTDRLNDTADSIVTRLAKADADARAALTDEKST